MARILLFDDDNAFRKLMNLLLVRAGHTVIEARNGKEGMALLPHSHADLLLTDMFMPEKDGLAVMMELWDTCPRLKIIAMSGGLSGISEHCLRAARLMGAVRVLHKPFSYEDLTAAVNEALAERTLEQIAMETICLSGRQS